MICKPDPLEMKFDLLDGVSVSFSNLSSVSSFVHSFSFLLRLIRSLLIHFASPIRNGNLKWNIFPNVRALDELFQCDRTLLALTSLN